MPPGKVSRYRRPQKSPKQRRLSDEVRERSDLTAPQRNLPPAPAVAEGGSGGFDVARAATVMQGQNRAKAVKRQPSADAQMAQARYDWNKATPKESPSVLTASPRERARAVARTPGAAESMAQAVNAWNKPKPPATEPPVDPAARARAMKRRSGDAEAMAQERYDMRGERYAPKTETEKVIPYRAAGKTYYGLEAERRRKVAELSPEAKAKVQRVAGQKPKPKPVVKKQGKRSAD